MPVLSAEALFAIKVKEKLDSFLYQLLKEPEGEVKIPATILNMKINQYGEFAVLFSKDVRYPKKW